MVGSEKVQNYADVIYGWCLKVSKSRKQFMVASILPKKRTKLTILSIFSTEDSELCSFFGRIEETIMYFRDYLTFNWGIKFGNGRAIVFEL